jgi:hypothetical protein
MKSDIQSLVFELKTLLRIPCEDSSRDQSWDFETGEVERFQAESGLNIPSEYIEWLPLALSMFGDSSPFFRGKPLVGFRIASSILLGTQEIDGRQIPSYLSFCEEDGNGLFVELCEDVASAARLYYTAPGIDPVYKFCSIRSFLHGYIECVKSGHPRLNIENAFGETRIRQDEILKRWGPDTGSGMIRRDG